MESGGADRGFFEIEEAAGDAWKQPNVGRGLAVADYDRDGAPDILITRNVGPPLLLRNNGGNRKSWLAVWLQGTKSNRDAIGARLSLRAAGERQLRQVGAGSSYLSQDDRVQLFGLGAQEKAEELEVWWPSGRRQRFTNLAARRMIRIVEGSSPQTVTPGKVAKR